MRRRAQCKAHLRASIAKNTPYLVVNPTLTLLHGASRTARCGATRRRIRTQNLSPTPCDHKVGFPRTLLLAIGAQGCARTTSFHGQRAHILRGKERGFCSQDRDLKTVLKQVVRQAWYTCSSSRSELRAIYGSCVSVRQSRLMGNVIIGSGGQKRAHEPTAAARWRRRRRLEGAWRARGGGSDTAGAI